MKILKTTDDFYLNIPQSVDFKTNAGWEENFASYENETMKKIINQVDNYETTRYIHKPYSGLTSNTGQTQCDIWFYFYFLDANNGYSNGLDYNLVGISPEENAMLLAHTVKSFFRIEFYSTPKKETQKLIFAKTLSLPLGQKVFYTSLGDYIHVPVFTGNNYRNSENMYFFWFQDNSVYSGDTFYISARFFNAEDGSILSFSNKNIIGSELNQDDDLYYEVQTDMTNHSYVIYEYDGSTGSRKGLRTTPINFYEIPE